LPGTFPTDPGVRLSRTGLLSKVRRDPHSGPRSPFSTGPQACSFCGMLSPALCPKHALPLAFPSTDRLPSTDSAADVTRLWHAGSVAQPPVHHVQTKNEQNRDEPKKMAPRLSSAEPKGRIFPGTSRRWLWIRSSQAEQATSIQAQLSRVQTRSWAARRPHFRASQRRSGIDNHDQIGVLLTLSARAEIRRARSRQLTIDRVRSTRGSGPRA